MTECTRCFLKISETFFNIRSLPTRYGNCRSACRHRTKFFLSPLDTCYLNDKNVLFLFLWNWNEQALKNCMPVQFDTFTFGLVCPIGETSEKIGNISSLFSFFYLYVTIFMKHAFRKCILLPCIWEFWYNNFVYQYRTQHSKVNRESNDCSFHISLSNTFWQLLFIFLLISSWNFHDVCQRFLYNQEQNFSLIRRKTKNFPIDPHYKNRPLL